MHPVGKVHGRGTLGQIHHMAFGSKHIDPVGADIPGQVIGQARQVAKLLLPFQHLAQPVDLGLIAGGTVAGIRALVEPVGTYTQFRLLVHLVGPDLYLHDLAFRPDDRCVQ